MATTKNTEWGCKYCIGLWCWWISRDSSCVVKLKRCPFVSKIVLEWRNELGWWTKWTRNLNRGVQMVLFFFLPSALVRKLTVVIILELNYISFSQLHNQPSDFIGYTDANNICEQYSFHWILGGSTFEWLKSSTVWIVVCRQQGYVWHYRLLGGLMWFWLLILDKILKCDHFNEIYWAVPACGTIDYAGWF